MKNSFSVFTFLVSVAVATIAWQQFSADPTPEKVSGRDGLFSQGKWRNPAAIRKNLDFSRLSGAAFHLAGQKQLLKDIRLDWQKEKVGIGLAHFVVKGDDGNKEFACEFYDRVQFVFIGEGIIENGRVPKMTVEGPCEMSENINRMKPIWLPVAKLKKYRPIEVKDRFFDEEKVSVSLEHLTDHWPSAWRINEMVIFHQVKAQRRLTIEPEQVKKIVAKKLLLEW